MNRKRASLPAKFAISIIGTLLFLVIIENLTRIAIKAGWIDYQPPMITQLPPGTEDWRKAHMTADRMRQPDPLLWWRPKEGPPYNEQGFKGPVVENPKPENTIRILVYGDSNTEGIPEDSWPDRLQLALSRLKGGRSYEVLNAGVAGYTSHQGLLRFNQEVPLYRPDIVIVAFGWNDLATATQPDKSYEPPPPAVIRAERILVKLRSYWALKQMFARRQKQQTTKLVSRVSLHEYGINLRQFLMLGKKHHAAVILVTRPHRDAVTDLRKQADYRTGVPDYNQMLLRICEEQRANCIDAEKHFADMAQPDHWGDECHFTESGRKEMGQLIAANLIRFRLI